MLIVNAVHLCFSEFSLGDDTPLFELVGLVVGCASTRQSNRDHVLPPLLYHTTHNSLSHLGELSSPPLSSMLCRSAALPRPTVSTPP